MSSRPDVITTSSGRNGMVISMNAYIDPANQAAYLDAVRPVVKLFRQRPENDFVAVTVNPKDAGHLRIVHGWKKDSAWFGQTFYNEPLFKDWLEKTMPMWTKERVIEHFDLVLVE